MCTIRPELGYEVALQEQKTIQQARSVGRDLNTLRHISAKDRKVLLKESITKSMNDKHNSEGQNKSKFKFLTTNSETRRSPKPSYLYKLSKEQARAIFMARTRMIKVKTNYKNMYTNTICRGCGLKEETQQHVLEECTSIHTQDNIKTPTNQLLLIRSMSPWVLWTVPWARPGRPKRTLVTDLIWVRVPC